jgi:cellulose synthase/poly-beta-1,6-N-acetylglucosamine synthase-like glycosyltransferase
MMPLFWLSICLLGWTFTGYPLTMFLLSRIVGYHRENRREIAADNFPHVTVIVAAYNEEAHIQRRIGNLLAQTYSGDRIDILLASDGSSDATVKKAQDLGCPNLRVLDLPRRGKALTHNYAVQHALGEILVFTDAQTEFAPDFLVKAVQHFSAQAAGCVVGNLIFRSSLSTAVVEHEQRFWSYEARLREWESRLGILATATGACMLVRKKLFRPLGPSGDSDFITPLDVIMQGYRVVQAWDAIAYDEPPASLARQFRARARMTAKNFGGTIRHWAAANWLVHPLITFGLFSHKVLRWLTPYFITLAVFASLWLVTRGTFYAAVFSMEMGLLCLAAAGLVLERSGQQLTLASMVLSFLVSNAGIAVGVIRAALGRVPASFTPGEN